MITLNDGNSIPAIGFGTYLLRGEDGVTAVRSALDAGYRLLDTAVSYQNEEQVGAALRASGIARDEVQVTSKLQGRNHGRDDAISSVEESLQRLGLEYLDLYLIHWPNPSVGRYVEAWTGLIEAQAQGLVRSIGVSNFTAAYLDRLIAETGVTPAVNQIELHPYFPQVEMRAANASHGILTQAWSPLGKQGAYDEPAVRAAATAHDVTPSQVILRWQIQLGNAAVPKSATPARQRENLDVFGFELSDDEVTAITALGRPDGRLFDGDPEKHEEM